MLEDKTIAVIRGGKSKEREVSLKTGKAILAALKKQGFQTIDLDPANDDLYQALSAEKIDVAFIALHGRFGEDGTIQGLLELKGIPYTGSGVLASSLAMDKVTSKRLFKQIEVTTPQFISVSKKDFKEEDEQLKSDIRKELKLPVVIKPALEGSSIGLSIVEEEEKLIDSIENAFKYDREVLIEEYIPGREITVGLLGDEDPMVLPIIEIMPQEGVYDFEAKYTKGMTKFDVPANLNEQVYNQAQQLALQAHQVLKCSGVSRVDLRVTPQGKPYVLEVNTIPGMTETSLLPQAAAAIGIDFQELVVRILKLALNE
ncbi:D-alanine--D-alanine ligase [Halobacteroides halobius DSM 5150]|uniref:D-alanine--D-alanine ligase n=1 Tax=Halobacteroides halobius (strain ATCC 35273 / DSM 5150 / MD-1) TaxID=748449 RepID=L0K9K9_HALHC|nr:D-alanine--D-alanine ligase [Halobacteroides halobius]AGB41701.1 D-alanine--D-alanine ligase [Halobacteroides halobius DSM 5150]